MQLALSVDSVQELDKRTEGWVTGLHLAGLALQEQQPTTLLSYTSSPAAIATSSTISWTKC